MTRKSGMLAGQLGRQMKKSVVRRALRFGVPLLFVAVVVHHRYVLAAATVEWTGFHETECCFFAPSLSWRERDAIHIAWTQARARVARFYGPLRAQTRLVVADAASYPRFATGATGMTHYLATGHAITVVGPPGHNVDVIAHELAHAELAARIGYLAITWCMPTWFDEGLAVQFDERPPFTERAYFARLSSGWRMPPLSTLATKASFFGGTRETVRFHYAGARVAVVRWLRSLSSADARHELESIDCGDAWRAGFREIGELLHTKDAPRR